MLWSPLCQHLRTLMFPYQQQHLLPSYRPERMKKMEFRMRKWKNQKGNSKISGLQRVKCKLITVSNA